MCKVCRNCGGYKLRYQKRKRKYQRRIKRAATPRKVQKKQKAKLQARAVKKNVLKIHASTQSPPVPSKILSPLCEKICLPSRPMKDLIEHSEITPQMIHQALRELTLWSDYVEVDKIFKYIRNQYPVNRNKKSLKTELIQKLQIAQRAGMVRTDNGGCYYRLHCSLEKLRQTPKPVVALFWEIYCNTMDPLQIKSRKGNPGINSIKEDKDSDSDSLPDENLMI